MQCGFLGHLGSLTDFTSESASHVSEVDFCSRVVIKKKKLFVFGLILKHQKWQRSVQLV